MRVDDGVFLVGFGAVAAACADDGSGGGTTAEETAADATSSEGAPTGEPEELCDAYGRRSAECQYEAEGYEEYVAFYTMVCEAELAMFEGECIALAEEFYACFGMTPCADLASGTCEAEAVAYGECLPSGSTG